MPKFKIYILTFILGIPGTYHHPPTDSGLENDCGYYVISKGLYVGIFDDRQVCLLYLISLLLTPPRDEIGSWVLGVNGSIFNRVATWEEARDLYNTHLTSGFIQILS